jgi:hypothetical protein
MRPAPTTTTVTIAAIMMESVSFFSPDIVRTLTPTVAAALVNTVSTLRIAERSTLTHKAVSIITDAKLNFCLSILRHTLLTKKVFTNKLTALSDGYVYMENNS